MATQSNVRKIIIIWVVVSLVLFAGGLLIGLYVIPRVSDNDTVSVIEEGCGETSDGQHMEITCTTTNFSETWKKYRERYIEKAVEDSCNNATCNTEDLPRTYIAYHLNGQNITIDGRLDDLAWEDIPWTNDFLDIRGDQYPEPRFNTKIKVRWNDERLYIGARMEETDFWGTMTEDETNLWEENSFEVFVVPDGSFHNYKEMVINVLNTTWDALMYFAYMDASGSTAFNKTWESGQEKATYTDGVINDPNGKGTYWTVEWSFLFESLAENTRRHYPTPDDDEVWYFNFARTQYHHKINGGNYEKDENKPRDIWSWQPTNVVNLHIPSRFGLIQFKQDTNDTSFHFNTWHIYRALLEIFYAEHKYKALNGQFSDDLGSLEMAPKILSFDCVNITVSVANSGSTFEAVVSSVLNPALPKGHIKQDRYVWFT